MTTATSATAPARLTHTTNKAYRRYMQMCSERLFIFIEGKTDRNFYDQICADLLVPLGIDYQLCTAKELPQSTGGKIPVLKFFKHLKRASGLDSTFKGKRSISIFFVDKDVDDLQNKVIESEHVVYTEHYHYENYLFTNGNLSKALAVAAGLQEASIIAKIGTENAGWTQSAADSWKDWVKLCAYAMKKRIGAACTYGASHSRINDPYQPINEIEKSNLLNILKIATAMSDIGFRRSFSAVGLYIDNIYAGGKCNSVFKGKWYLKFMVEEAKIIAGGKAYRSNSLEERLLSALETSLDYSEPWSLHFKQPVKALVDRF